MLFNSFLFIIVFMPSILMAFFAARKYLHHNAALVVLCVGSLIFYGWWDARYTLLIVGSITFNFFAARIIVGQLDRHRHGAAKAVMLTAVCSNLGLLGWYKYSGFFAMTLNTVLGQQIPVPHIALPLAISFFTFQQIAFIVDVWHGSVRGYSPIKYFSFILFFPHLLAGPILYHARILPQFEIFKNRGFRLDDFAIGSAIFAIGLAKKTIIADPIAVHVNALYASAAQGTSLDFVAAWSAALGYTAQIYFDFSGYSDMAVGLGRMFGIVLPVNFFSPYKSTSIIEFWRRWHITLSNFLKVYLYFSIGGNRCGGIRRYTNLLITMLLGGLWHGAGWTFILWGGLHGVGLIINHGWRAVRPNPATGLERGLGWLLTFMAVVVAWVLFRAPEIAVAGNVFKGMAGVHGVVLPIRLAELMPSFLQVQAAEVSAIPLLSLSGMLAVAFAIAFLAPNTYQILGNWKPGDVSSGFDLVSRLSWRPTAVWGVAMGVVAAIAMMMMMDGQREFLYYNF